MSTAEQIANEPRIPYFQLLTSRTFIGCVAATFGAYWALSLGLTWFTPFIVQGLGFSQKDAGWVSVLPWVFGATIVLLTGWISQVMLTKGYTTRGARGVLGAAPLVRRRLHPCRAAACQRRRPADCAAGDRLRPLRLDLCGLSADARRIHAGVAARRRDSDLRRALYAGRHPCAHHHGQRDQERPRPLDGYMTGFTINAAIMVASGVLGLLLALAQQRARAACGTRGSAEVRVTVWAIIGLHGSRRAALPRSSP